LCPTKVTVSMRRVLLRFYQGAGLVVARVGLWGAEMGVRFRSRWEKVQDGTELCTKELVLGGFPGNEGYCVHGEGTVEVLSSCWIAGGDGWLVGFRVQVEQCIKVGKSRWNKLTQQGVSSRRFRVERR
jgi:hypothetical protein